MRSLDPLKALEALLMAIKARRLDISLSEILPKDEFEPSHVTTKAESGDIDDAESALQQLGTNDRCCLIHVRQSIICAIVQVSPCFLHS